MSKINLIKQLRARAKAEGFANAVIGADKDAEVQFEEESGSGRTLDPHEKRKVLMLFVGVLLVLGGRQLLPLYTSGFENEARKIAADLDQKLAIEKQKSAALELIKQEMEQYELRVTDLRAKLSKVQQLEADRNLLVRMSDYIVKEMPQRLWFEKLEIDTRTKVVISGFSSNYQVVSDFMKKLEGAVYFPHWKLLQTRSEDQRQGGGASAAAPASSVIAVPADSKRFELEAETVKL